MTTTRTAPHLTEQPRRRAFRPVLRSEWIKFRTVRGWLIGLVVAGVLCVAFTFLTSNGRHEGTCTSPNPASCRTGHPFVPTGPDGEAVADSYYFVDQPITGNGTITAEVVSLRGLTSTAPLSVAPSLADTRPGLAAWAKAGMMVTASAKQGSAYAAVMATGRHGVRWQYNYTHDRAGPPEPVSSASPRWLRLTRSGATLTGYDSTNGTIWIEIGTTRLAGLPSTVVIGLFVTSPVSFQGSNGAATDATATFDHVSIQGAGASNDWHGHSIGSGSESYYPTLGSGDYHRSDASFVVSGSGDIAPAVGVGLIGVDTAGSILLLGLIVGLIVMIVLATMFITTEYRRGLIRTTFTATPDRRRVLVAKAVVIGAVAFVTVAIAAVVAILLGEHIASGNGNYILPVSALTDVRIVAGAAAVGAVTAVAVLALGAILRKSAGAVTAGIVVFVLPYVLGQLLSGSAQEWLFRLTPAAGFDVLGTLARSAQVAYPYTFGNGYYPLVPWAGLLVLCAYAAAALGLATIVVRRRDA
jgi:ABC-type transport system involved in multi-copper enzyme maturation permease subunit